MAQNKRTKEEYAKIAEEIRKEYAKVKSLEIYSYEDGIHFCCEPWGQKIQYETAGKLMGIASVNTYKSKLARKLNKWCANSIFKSIEKYNLEPDEVHICV